MIQFQFRSWAAAALFLCLGSLASGQTRDRAIVSGTVIDATTGETLIGAHIVSDGATPSGTMSNEYGYFNLSVPADASHVLFKYIGYVTDTLDLRDTPLQNRDIQLKPVSILTDAAVIEAQGNTAIEQGERLGTLELRPAEARSIPQLFGERDVIKAIQLMPGVQATSDGGSGFFVRGGGADQNLILLDEAPVYNPSHLLGFFSVFNGDALNNADLYKSGIPARYGGRASS
ncbi:MAG: carboxypeptidase-like regulatory domain-containing protein, partial [Flavobacteriales bacterium]